MLKHIDEPQPRIVNDNHCVKRSLWNLWNTLEICVAGLISYNETKF